MGTVSENNKRIVKNTLMLYFRQILIMFVGLYTVRVVLNTLGVEDYGIYNIVGGVVVLFSFLSSALTQATQRFLSIELGKNDLLQFNRVFSLSFLVYLFLALFTLLLTETIGLWFLNTYLNIAENRMYAANWVYQISILTYICGLLRTPYNASILAHERMSFYAYMSFLEVSLSLFVVFILTIGTFDKLILYSILLFFVSVAILWIYKWFCISKYEECKYHFFWDPDLFSQLVSFSGWSMFGSMSVIATNQGVNILLNLFHGVATNAAMGITNQVSNAVNQFVNNFQIAFNPRIVKSYAEKDHVYLESLMFRSAKLSFFLLLILSVPILIKTETILTLWLHNIPEYVVTFIHFSLLALLIDSLSGPLWMVVQAIGKIKKYQLVISSIFWMNFIFSLLFLQLGFSPVVVFQVRCIISLMLLFTRLYLLVGMMQFKSGKFVTDVLMRCLFVAIIAILPSYLCSLWFSDLLGLLFNCLIAFSITPVVIYGIGLQKNERSALNHLIKKKVLALWHC